MMNADSHENLFSTGALIDDRYEICDLLDSSEQEMIFMVKDRILDSSENLLKVFIVNENTTRKQLERFRAEVIITRRLSHPNIAGIYDLGRFKERYFYITQEASKGIPLSEILKKQTGSGLPVMQVLEITYQILHALSEIHKKGVLHRNINPQNILVEYDNDNISRVVLTHFGYGKILGFDMGLTKTGDPRHGNTAYMSPEQIRGDEIDQRSDLYSIGMLAYSLLAGINLENEITKGSSHEKEQLNMAALGLQIKKPIIQEEVPDTPEWFSKLLNKLIEHRKNERPENAEFVLEEILSNTPVRNKKKKEDKIRSANIGPLSFNRNAAIALSIFTILCSIGIPFHGEILNLSINSLNSEKINDSKAEKLAEAIKKEDEPLVFRLLKEGADPRSKDASGRPLIILAAETGNAHIAYTILSENSSGINDTDQNGVTPLIAAVKADNMALINLMLQHGADPTLKDESGKSACDYSAGSNQNKLTEFCR
ncbi:MAG TPA: protein kinase [Oligoflexia bacterium]|nr:protein kinase [Oligoflexia bacterium]HMP48066.1 protein kinase [Oligoflexia bacterium]